MASTYSPNLRLELIGTGEQQGTWGVTTNTNLGTLIEEAIGGYVSVTVSDSIDTTLTTVNGGADQSRNMVINLTGALTATRNVICPAIEKVYIVKNATTGSQAVVFKVTGQTGVTIPNGATVILYVDGTDARQVTGSLAAQSANSVSITGGNITGITNLAASNVAFTGGTISGLSNLSVANATVATTVRSNLGAAASGANTDITSVYLDNTGLKIKDTDASHGLSIVPGSNLTADRVLTLTTGDAARTVTISANTTISQDYSTTGNPQFATIELGAATDTTLSRVSAGVIAVEGVTVPTISSTNTLTNKRVTPRMTSTTSTTSPWAWNSDGADTFAFTALANSLTINADAGTPTDGQRVVFRFKPNTTNVSLTWTTGSTGSFRAIGITLPTALTNAKTTYVGCIYNSADSRWDAVATQTEA